MIRWIAGLAALAFAAAGAANAQNTIKIGYIDPLSGAFAQQGDASLKHFAYLFDIVNAKGGALGRKFEIVPYDSKLQPAEALIALKSITDQNIPFVMHCAGSNVAAALIDGVAKHNARNPNNRVLYLNCGALASDLTNEQCNFWHFRFDANTGMRAETLVRGLPQSLKAVYLMNQDYLFGQTLQKETKLYLEKLRPDIKIVGEELIPLGKVKDFAPYVSKIKAAGAESLITGNWGPDLNLLLKSAVESGADWSFYTYLAHVVGGPTSVGSLGENRLHTVTEFHPNVPGEAGNAAGEKFVAEWRKTADFDLFQMNNYVLLHMLADAINKAGSTDPFKVAMALEDAKGTDVMGKPYVMRKLDHQLLEPLYLARFVKDAKYDSEKTGLGWKTISMTEGPALDQPSVCQMKRPTN
jgi:branched-chain amino acid transport system substrate-binding protein